MRPRQYRVKLNRNNPMGCVGMVPLPRTLTPTQTGSYPPDNHIPFERWFMDNYREADQRERIYLPIQWTSLYCNNNYGKCHKTKLHIQGFLNGLDASKKYYTIVQYDDGILNTITHLDLKVFAMSGPRVDYPLPLLGMPHPYRFTEKRDLFASFIGRVTHPIRAEMIRLSKGQKNFYISTEQHKMEDYCRILARSKFALCPRGYGQTSFRIQEAIQYGAIPVYISDSFIIPYNIQGMFPCIHSEHIIGEPDGLNEMLWFGALTNNYESEIAKHAHLFTYEGCKSKILEELKREQDENTSA